MNLDGKGWGRLVNPPQWSCSVEKGGRISPTPKHLWGGSLPLLSFEILVTDMPAKCPGRVLAACSHTTSEQHHCAKPQTFGYGLQRAALQLAGNTGFAG